MDGLVIQICLNYIQFNLVVMLFMVIAKTTIVGGVGWDRDTRTRMY